MLRKPILVLFAAAAGAALAAATGPVSAEAKGPKDGPKIREALKKLYGKYDYADTLGRSEVINEIHNLAMKDKKDPALRYSAWWSEQMVEAIYSGDKWVKGTASTKKVDKIEIEVGAWKVPMFVRGPNNYSKGRSSPMIISFVDAKIDAKTWLEKSWAANEEIAKEYILAAVQDSPQFDVVKNPSAPVSVVGKLFQTYNIDPNRIFVEGAGGSCRTAQTVATTVFPDRFAGLILRNPLESFLTENIAQFTTVVVHGPEGTEKAKAVFEAAKKQAGDDTRAALVAAPDLASLEGMCLPVVEWLKTAKPRSLPLVYGWTATIDKDNNCPNSWTGSIIIRSPVTRPGTVTMKVNMRRDTNTVDIQATNLSEFTVCLNDDLMDLDKEVAILVNGKEVARKVFPRNTTDMITLADTFAEYGRIYPVQVNASAPSAAAAVAAPGAGDKKDGDKK